MPKNIAIAASLPARPERLFDMYLDSTEHGAFTGQPVTIEPRAGAVFSAFGGMIRGKILHIEPKRQLCKPGGPCTFLVARSIQSCPDVLARE